MPGTSPGMTILQAAAHDLKTTTPILGIKTFGLPGTLLDVAAAQRGTPAVIGVAGVLGAMLLWLA